MEVDSSASLVVEARLTRRLIALEVADVTVPPPPGVRPEVAALHFRVLTERGDSVRVELWQLGQAHGARSVSSRGSAQLRARRIALAAAELARQLRHRRNVEAILAAKEAARAEEERRRARGLPIYGRPSLLVGVQGAAVGPGDFSVLGPTLGFALRLSNGAALELGGSYLTGAAPAASDAGMRWMEVSLAPSYRLWHDRPTSLGVGLVASAAASHFSDVLAVDGQPSQSGSWSARAALTLSGEHRLSDDLGLRLGLDAGVVLRRLVVTPANGPTERLGGLWLGLTGGLVFDPLGPSK